jgi:hypothetical protein
MDPCKRFEPPDFRIRRIVGAGFLNVVCRKAPSGATDIWMQVYHTGADGSPMQELLTRLEIAWGTEAGILFPTDTGLPPKVLPCFASEEERPLHLVTDFIDFLLLFQLRDDLKKRFAKRGIEAVPLSALFLWCLAHQPEFEGIKFANAVDVPANETKERGVDLVPIRPSEYWDQRGFAAYLRDFNQLILDARNRRTRSYLTMWNLAVLPPMLSLASLCFNSGAGRLNVWNRRSIDSQGRQGRRRNHGRSRFRWRIHSHRKHVAAVRERTNLRCGEHQGRVRSDSRLPDGHSPCHRVRIASEFLIGKNARHVLAPFST